MNYNRMQAHDLALMNPWLDAQQFTMPSPQLMTLLCKNYYKINNTCNANIAQLLSRKLAGSLTLGMIFDIGRAQYFGTSVTPSMLAAMQSAYSPGGPVTLAQLASMRAAVAAGGPVTREMLVGAHKFTRGHAAMIAYNREIYRAANINQLYNTPMACLRFSQ